MLFEGRPTSPGKEQGEMHDGAILVTQPDMFKLAQLLEGQSRWPARR